MKDTENPTASISTLGHVEARSQLYQCFATAFSDPGDDFLNSVFDGEFLEALHQLGNRLPYPGPFDTTVKTLVPQGIQKQDIKVFYASCFEAGNQGASLRESGYSTLPEKARMEEIFRFYQYFGLDFSAGQLRELPDSLPVELEFMHYLTFLEAKSLQAESLNEAAENNINALQLAQRDFLSQHLGTWVQPFALKLESVLDCSFYPDLARLLQLFIQCEKRFLTGASDELIATT
jgi:DMSO reductase family type II enzyme chaperone